MRYIILVLIVLGFPSASMADVIDTLAQHRWAQVGSNTIADVAPSPLLSARSPSGGGLGNVITAWSGGTFDTTRNRLLVWGGGHGDYAGNEIYAFDFATLAWSRLNDPSLLYEAVGWSGDETSGHYSDGTPRARHTYNYLAYLPTQDQMCSMGGAAQWPSGQQGTGTVDCWDFGASGWVTKTSPAIAYGIGANAVRDPSTGHIWVRGTGGATTHQWAEYNPATDTWVKRTDYWDGTLQPPANVFDYYKTSVVDPVNNILYSIGGGEVYWWDLDPVTYTGNGYIQGGQLTTTGGDSIVNANSPGIAWDPNLQKIVGWSGGASVYAFDSATNTWADIVDAGNTTTPTAAPTNGTFGRFQYVPSRGVLAVVNATNQPVYVFKTGTPQPYNSGNLLQSFNLTSQATGTVPFTVGLGFKKGDTTAPTLDLTDYQVTIKKTWDDGSVKHAIVSGTYSSTAGVAKTVNVYAGGLAPSGTALTEADIVTAAPTASIQAGTIGTVNLSGLLGSPVRTWISGPEMVEAHYQSAIGADPTLVAKFHVRLYKGGAMRVRAIVENGALDVATAQKDYVPTITIGGSTVYDNGAATLNHYAHTRYDAVGWIGTDPQITVAQDTTYLMASKLVPNYWKTGPSSAALDALTQTYTPMQKGDWTTSMGSAGYQAQIGLLPNWDALYLNSGGDARAYKSVLANARSLNSYGMIWADSATDAPIVLNSWPTWSVAGAGGGGDNDTVAGALTWETAHHGSGGFLAYLLTGDYYFLETMQYQATRCYLAGSSTGGSGTARIYTGQTRAIAWVLRSVGQLSALAPSGTISDDLRSWLGSMATHWHDKTQLAGQNLLGYIYDYSANAPNFAYADNHGAPWQQHFWMQVMGHVSDLEPLVDMSTWNATRDHLYKGVVGILGTNGAENFCYTKGSSYSVQFSASANVNDPTGWYDSWGEVYTGTFGADNTACGNTLEGTSGGAPTSATGYWGNLLPAIAYAAEHGAPGAADSWARLTGASNFSTLENSGFADTPIWGIYPRQVVNVPLGCTPQNGGVEICGNGIDEDCSGSDLACPSTGRALLGGNGKFRLAPASTGRVRR